MGGRGGGGRSREEGEENGERMRRGVRTWGGEDGGQGMKEAERESGKRRQERVGGGKKGFGDGREPRAWEGGQKTRGCLIRRKIRWGSQSKMGAEEEGKD